MAVNLAAKFESKTSELLRAARKSKEFTHNNWSWDGVATINIYTLTDPTMVNYGMPTDGTTAFNARYGAATEVQDTVQQFTLSRDRAWSKTIDKRNFQDTNMIRKPGKYLAQATKNVLVPEIDAYVFQSISTAGVTGGRAAIAGATFGATTSANAYTNFLNINADITNNEAPEGGRVAAMTATYYNLLKQGGFVLNSDLAYKDRKSGDLGEVDGVRVVIVPSTRMPANTDLIISHADVCAAPEKLVDYTLHQNPVGISGDVLEYRHRYDAFVDANKVNQIGIHRTAA